MPLAITPTFTPWTHTSDDSYIYQLSLVLATATVFLTYHTMFRVVPAAHAKPHAQQQIARDLEVDYETFLTNVRGPPDKYGLLTLGRLCVRC